MGQNNAKYTDQAALRAALRSAIRSSAAKQQLGNYVAAPNAMTSDAWVC